MTRRGRGVGERSSGGAAFLRFRGVGRADGAPLRRGAAGCRAEVGVSLAGSEASGRLLARFGSDEASFGAKFTRLLPMGRGFRAYRVNRRFVFPCRRNPRERVGAVWGLKALSSLRFWWRSGTFRAKTVFDAEPGLVWIRMLHPLSNWARCGLAWLLCGRPSVFRDAGSARRGSRVRQRLALNAQVVGLFASACIGWREGGTIIVASCSFASLAFRGAGEGRGDRHIVGDRMAGCVANRAARRVTS